MEKQQNDMADFSARKYLLSNAWTNLLRVGMSSLATLIITPFIIRNIGIDNYSYVALTSFFISFSGLFDLGLSKSLVYLLNEPSVDAHRKNQYLTAQGGIVLGICALILGVGGMALLGGYPILGPSLPATDPSYGVVIVASFLVLMLTVFDQFLSAVLESFFLLPHVNHGLTLKIMTLNVLYVINLFTWNSLPFYVFSSVVAILVATAYYWGIIRRHVHWEIRKPSAEAVKKLVRQSFHFFRFSVLNSIYGVLPRMSVMYLSADLASIGILDVVEKLSMSVINLCASIFRPLFSLSCQSPQKVARKLTTVMCLNGGVGLLFVGGMVVFNSAITNYFFPHASIDKAFIGQNLVLYAIGSFFLLMSQPLSFYLQGEGKTSRLSVVFLGNIVLFFLLYLPMKEVLDWRTLQSLATCHIIISAFYWGVLFDWAKKTSLNRLKV